MLPTGQGSLKLFRLAGIQVYLHWSWFLVAFYEIKMRRSSYGSYHWNALEYICLFLIVLMHEFGHSLACRQVGGKADQIVLWPLGGVAYVAPPQRPGATLWSIAAGPLVNVALTPIFAALYFFAAKQGWEDAFPNLFQLISTLWIINTVLLVFNLLPVYPLDGGQILRSLLWFVIGRARSLMVASIIGFAGVAGLLGVALYTQSPWMGILAVFAGINCWRGFQQARILARVAKLPRREGLACPECRTAPVIGPYWICGTCKQPFDIFAALAQCPNCGTRYSSIQCLDCGQSRPMEQWVTSVAPPPLPGQASSSIGNRA
jgi:Zn-dependent protease